MLDLISVGLETIKDEDCFYADKSMTFSDSADIQYFIVHFQKWFSTLFSMLKSTESF